MVDQMGNLDPFGVAAAPFPKWLAFRHLEFVTLKRRFCPERAEHELLALEQRTRVARSAPVQDAHRFQTPLPDDELMVVARGGAKQDEAAP
jgi:hypothetical protein